MTLREVQRTDGATVWIEPAPSTCANGHLLGPGQVVVSWMPCSCTEGHRGHRTHTCRICDVVTHMPEHRAPQTVRPGTYRPSHG